MLSNTPSSFTSVIHLNQRKLVDHRAFPNNLQSASISAIVEDAWSQNKLRIVRQNNFLVLSSKIPSEPAMERPPLPMCGICLTDQPVNGIQLECRHIFCYLCVKSASEMSCICPLCRAPIGNEFNFQNHEILGAIKAPTSRDGHYWFYEGFRGWWLYDAETNSEIEEAFRRGTKKIEKFIAGGIYVLDLERMMQVRKDDPHGRARRIRRDTLELNNILGMAGLKGEDFQDTLQMMREADRIPPMASRIDVNGPDENSDDDLMDGQNGL